MLDLQAFHVYVQGVVSRSGISVVWDKPDSTPRTDGKKVYLPRPKGTTSEGELVALKYALKHEVSHLEHTDFAFWAKHKCDKQLHTVRNILEDHRIDFLNDRRFAGDRRLSAAFWEDYASRITTGGRIESPFTPAFAWDFSLRDWIPTARLAQGSVTAFLTPDEALKVAKLAELAPLLLEVRADPSDNEGMLVLADKVYAILFDGAPKEMPDDGGKETPEGGAGGAEGDKPEGMGGKPSPEKGKGEPFPGMVDDLAPDEDAEAGGFAAELDHDGTFQPAPLSEWAKPIPSRYGPTVNVAECVASIHTTAAPITNKLRSLLQVRSLSHYEYGQKKGKLVQGALATLALTNNDRVFKRKVESDTLDVAVSILLDMSGSMDGARIQNATLAVAALSKALGVVRVAHCVTGFTNSFDDGKPMHIPVVQWDRPTHADNIPTEVSKWKLCDNADGEHILRAANELMQRKEKRKLLVVMSDGSPECGRRPHGLKRYTMDLIKYLEEKTPIEIMSLGMMYDTSRLYKRSVCVNKAEDIPSGLLSLLSSSF